MKLFDQKSSSFNHSLIIRHFQVESVIIHSIFHTFHPHFPHPIAPCSNFSRINVYLYTLCVYALNRRRGKKCIFISCFMNKSDFPFISFLSTISLCLEWTMKKKENCKLMLFSLLLLIFVLLKWEKEHFVGNNLFLIFFSIFISVYAISYSTSLKVMWHVEGKYYYKLLRG